MVGASCIVTQRCTIRGCAGKCNLLSLFVSQEGSDSAYMSTLQRLQQAPTRIAEMWNILEMGLNFTGLSVVETPRLTVPGQLEALGVRLDNTTTTPGWVK